MYCLIVSSFLWLFQYLPGVQQPSGAKEELQVEEQFPKSHNNERKAPEKELEHTEEEQISEEEEVQEDDRAKEEDELNSKQAVEASEWPIEEPVKEIQTPSQVEEDVAEVQKEVDLTEELEALQEAHMVTNEIEVDEIQAVLEDSDHVTVETGEITDERVEVSVGEEIKIHSEIANMVTSETKKRIEEATAGEVQTLLKDTSTITTETEEAAVEKHVELTPTQETQTGLEETGELSNVIEEVFREEHAEHTNEISAAEITTQEDGNVEQESGIAMEEIQIPVDEMDIATNGNVDDQVMDNIPAENEQEAVEELTAASAQESLVSGQSVEEV